MWHGQGGWSDWTYGSSDSRSGWSDGGWDDYAWRNSAKFGGNDSTGSNNPTGIRNPTGSNNRAGSSNLQIPIPVPFAIPNGLLDAVNSCRPVCSFWRQQKDKRTPHNTPGSCRKGAHCPNLHIGDKNNEARLPHVSRLGDELVITSATFEESSGFMF
jgi:hypothetical protein